MFQCKVLCFTLSQLAKPWCCGFVVIATAQLYLTKPQLRFHTGSNPARSKSQVFYFDGKDHW